MKNSNYKGITLIALVVTIIVLLILAGVSIATLTGENGILGQAERAKEEHENAQNLEDTRLANYENKINEYVDGTRSTSLYSITKLGEATGNTPIPIDATKYDELYIEVRNGVNLNINQVCSETIKTIALTNEQKIYVENSTHSASGYYSAIYVTLSEISIASVRASSTDYTSKSTIVVYGVNY